MNKRTNLCAPGLGEGISSEVSAAVLDQRANGHLSPYACTGEHAIRRSTRHDAGTVQRPSFVRDSEKIIHLPAYNRLAGKTQVFSLRANDDISRRGLHVQLVSRVARDIGLSLGLNLDLIEAIALGHDIGHTPFGHAGERFLSQCYHERTGRYFNHNVHSVRVMDTLYRRNISLQVLDGALCHNGEFEQQKLERSGLSTFEELDAQAEACMRDENVIATLRPATLEGCVVRVADMIAYLGKDRADAQDIGVLGSLDAFESRRIGRDNARIINNMTVDIVNASYGRETIAMSEAAFADLKLAKRQNYELIYDHEGWRAGSGNVVGEMFERMYARLLDDLAAGREESPIFTHHARYLERKSRSISAEAYVRDTEPDQVVVDYMASMTDRYFMALWRHLFPDDEHDVIARGYCADLEGQA